ncbi:pro-neuregulin-3, membrane-bound isoform isoform X2 [Nerophis ophidion]|uniref:pro-neuregulin-3, membrane-bound isoform isoform X2 n=1 Tax=Nerophis ophidion TaxID=159077 RepID=UPI002AE019FE|nr:pro-neuregulin-3, membrane-bound isoform isoform X2 [Nerophis ophidion]
MSRKGGQGRMSECSAATGTGSVILEEPEGSGVPGAGGEGQARDGGPFRCALWPRQQTWLCAVPLLIGFIGLGLSLMLLKWIVVGTVRDYVPTDLVDANRIGQDPIFLSKPSGIPKGPETTTSTAAPTGDGRNVSPTTGTVAKGRTRTAATTTTANPRGGAASGSLATPRNPGNRNGRIPVGFTTPAAPPLAPTSSRSPSNPTVLHDSTQMWTSDHTTTEVTSTTTTTARRHGHRKSPSASVPPLHSEHFKPCHDKDLAYCLNGGECFVIETLSGPHKHCKCREGYQGIRCDQFLPKTDSILSDPNHLGIEFMESKEVYKRQLLSITSIAMAIGLLGVVCVALYCRNKRRTHKLEVHLKETRSLRNYTTHDNMTLKYTLHNNTPHYNTTHNCTPHKTRQDTRNTNQEVRSNQCCKRPPACRHGDAFANISTTPAICSRNTAQQRGLAAHWSAPRRTPPIASGRSKSSGPAYQHLQEVELAEQEAQQSVVQQGRPRPHMQSPAAAGDHAIAAGPCGLQRPNGAASVPIIASVLGRHDDEISCMQTGATPRLEAEQEAYLRALARRRRQDGACAAPPPPARETVCFLNLHVGGAGGPLCDGPTHTQLLSPAPHKDLAQ